MNSRLCALLAMGLSLLAVPGLRAQQASVAADAAIRGDVDGDGRVTPADAEAVRAYLVRGTLPGGRSIMPAGDANGDGRVTAADAALISRFAAGVDVARFPVGRPVGEGARAVPSDGALMFTEYECTADTRTTTVVCGLSSPAGTGGARQDVLLYGSGAKVAVIGGATHTNYNDGGVTPDTMKVTLAVTNLLPQPIGTTDGVTADTVRLVFTGYVQANANANVVTADGTATFTDSVNAGGPYTFPNRQYMDYPELIAPNATSAPQEVRIAYNQTLTTLGFKYRIWSRVQYNRGNVVISPADSVIGAGQSVDLGGSSFTVTGAPMAAESYTWQSSNNAIATVDGNGVVQGLSGGTVTITATAATEAQRGGTRVIRVIQANPETVDVTGNVRVSAGSVLTNDSIHSPVNISFVGWNGTPNASQQGGQVAMNTTPGPGFGTFTYNPPAGFDGTDSVAYTITSGTFAVDTGKVALTVEDMIWFVRNGGDPCTSRAAGCGRLLTPYSSLNAFRDENNGTGNNPEAGDAIFLYESATPHTLTGTPLTLLADQKLIGQDAGAPLASIANITLATGSDALPGMNPGADATTIGGTVGGVVLGANNLLRGFGISTGGGTALAGTSFGTPTITEVPVAATNGQALRLDGGTVNSTSFPTVTSSGSPRQGVSLRSITGTLTITAGSISDADSAALLVSGGDVTLTWPGSIDQTNNAPLVDVLAHASPGVLTFPGALSASNGAGLQFNSAQGSYTFSGTATLGGTDAGIDITNGSAGTFTFGTGTQITNSTGTGLNVYGSAPTGVTYSGSITKSGTNAGRLVEIGEMTGGTVTFAAGSTLSSSSTLGTGISLSNADGTVNFNGTNTLTGGDAGVDVLSNSTGTIAFSATSSISNPSGIAFLVNGSSPTSLTYPGTITANGSRAVEVSNGSNAACGTIGFSGNLAGSGASASGILVNRCSAGTITFSGASKSFSTQANGAVTITNNGATVDFTNGGLVLATTSGAGFTASGGGTVSVTTGGTNNTVNSNGGGTAVNLSGTTIGGSGMTFYSINATGSGTNGVVLSSTGAGAFQVTGDGASDPNNTTRGRTTAKSGGGSVALGSGGTISGRSGHGVSLSSTGPVTLRNMVITGSGSSGDGINASSTGRLTLDNTRITGHASDHGILGNTVSGLSMHHSEVDNNGTTVGVVEGPDIWNIRLLGLTGTDSIRNSNIHHSQENVLGIINTSGVLNLTVLNTNITDTGTGAGGSIALMLGAAGSSNMTVNLQNDSINRGRARGVQASTETASSAVLNLTVNNSQFHQNGGAIDLSHGSSGTNTFSITNNNLQAGAGSLQAVIVNRLGSPSFNSFGLFTGTVSGNTIGTAGTPSSGSDTSSGIEVESNGSGGIMRVAVVNNTVREVGLHGIYVAAVDANIGGTAPPLLEARVASNTISNMEAVGLDGIHVLPGALNTDDLTMCIDIANNNSTGIRNGLRVRPSGLPAAPSTVQLEGWDGVTAVNTYFTNRPNTLAGGTAPISTTAPPAPGGFVAVANCNTP